MKEKKLDIYDMSKKLKLKRITFLAKLYSIKKITPYELLAIADILDINPFEILIDWKKDFYSFKPSRIQYLLEETFDELF